MTSVRDEHPDEGTIHAWLDRQLDDDAAAELEAHLQRCDACAERVAEARGLIAGASRIVAALDIGQPPIASTAPPAGAWPPAIVPAARTRTFPSFRLTPARSAIAAVLVVAVATAIVHEYERPTSRVQRDESAVSAAAPQAVASAPTLAPSPVPSARPGSLPASAPVVPPIDSTAAMRVAAARTFAKAQQETTVNADRVRVDQAPAAAAPTATEPAVAVAKAADSAVERRSADASVPPGASPQVKSMVAGGVARASAPSPSAAPVAANVGGIEAPQCYRVESANGAAASWGPVALPLTLALDAPATRNTARVLTAGGQHTDVSATFERRANDSLVFTLRRIGYTGSLALGAPGEVRAGVMRSAPTQLALEGVVTTATPTTTSRASERKSAASQRRSDSTPAVEQRAATAEPAVPVVVRRVECGR